MRSALSRFLIFSKKKELDGPLKGFVVAVGGGGGVPPWQEDSPLVQLYFNAGAESVLSLDMRLKEAPQFERVCREMAIDLKEYAKDKPVLLHGYSSSGWVMNRVFHEHNSSLHPRSFHCTIGAVLQAQLPILSEEILRFWQPENAHEEQIQRMHRMHGVNDDWKTIYRTVGSWYESDAFLTRSESIDLLKTRRVNFISGENDGVLRELQLSASSMGDLTSRIFVIPHLDHLDYFRPHGWPVTASFLCAINYAQTINADAVKEKNAAIHLSSVSQFGQVESSTLDQEIEIEKKKNDALKE